MADHRTVYFIMVCHPANGWMRVGGAYSSKENARGWTSFVKSAWRGLPVKVRACKLVMVDGVPDEASRRRLDVEFNMDYGAESAEPATTKGA